MTIFPLLYFPPISYFKKWESTSVRVIECFEHFPKQTFRNRMSILTPNGRKDLTIPICHPRKNIYKQTLYSTGEDWKANHWKSLKTCYHNSPYFDHYKEQLRELIYNSNPNLFEYNLEIFNWIIKTFHFSDEYTISEDYVEVSEKNDLRNFFNKKVIPFEKTETYIQVFSDRFEFENNLSILDFLLNQGPYFIKN